MQSCFFCWWYQELQLRLVNVENILRKHCNVIHKSSLKAFLFVYDLILVPSPSRFQHFQEIRKSCWDLKGKELSEGLHGVTKVHVSNGEGRTCWSSQLHNREKLKRVLVTNHVTLEQLLAFSRDSVSLFAQQLYGQVSRIFYHTAVLIITFLLSHWYRSI